MTFIVKYQDRFGRVVYAPAKSVVDFYAEMIASGDMSMKALKECEAFEATSLDLTQLTAQIQTRTKRIELLIRVKNGGPGAIAEMLNKKQITIEEAAEIRQDIIRRWPFDCDNFKEVELS